MLERHTDRDETAPAPGGAAENPNDEQFKAGANRPANNARLATPGAMLAKNWQAQDGVSDFLGLDRDLRGSGASNVAPVGAAPTAEQAHESWLLGMNEEPAAEVVPTRAAPAAPAAEITEELPLRAELSSSTSWREEPTRRSGMKKQLTRIAACLVIGMLGMTALQFFRAPGGDVSTDSTPLAAAQNPTPAYASGPSLANETPAPREVLPQATGSEADSVAASNERSFDDLVTTGTTPRETRSPAIPNETAFSSEPPRPADSVVAASSSSLDASSEPVESASSALAVDDSTQGDEGNGGSDAVRTVAEESGDVTMSTPADEIASSASTPAAEHVAPRTPFDPLASSSVPPIGASSAAVAAESRAPAPLSKPLEGNFLMLAAMLKRPPAAASELQSPSETALAQAESSSVPPGAVERAPGASTEVPASGSSAPGAVASANTASIGPALPATFELEPVGASQDDRVRTTKLKVEDVLLQRSDKSTLRRANASELAAVWSEKTIPFDAISSPTKILTPSVGRVRVILKTNEIFEGTLYAMGESCVWIDTQYGRMGLAGSRVQTVAQIDGGTGTPALGAPGSQSLTGLERVRIKTPGGVLYGKVIVRDAVKTTVLTDDGARITLDTKDVELVVETPKITLKP